MLILRNKLPASLKVDEEIGLLNKRYVSIPSGMDAFVLRHYFVQLAFFCGKANGFRALLTRLHDYAIFLISPLGGYEEEEAWKSTDIQKQNR